MRSPALWLSLSFFAFALPAGAALLEPLDDGSVVEVAPGGLLSQAFPPSGGGVLVLGALGAPGGDVDVYRFDVAAGEIVTATLSTDDAGAFHDPLIALRDGAGSEVVRDDDGGSGFEASLRHEVTAAECGAAACSWSLAVTGFPDGAFGGAHAEVFAYQLAISVSAGTPAESESNDDLGSVELVPDGAAPTSFFTPYAPGDVTVVHGRLEPGDVDFFEVPVRGAAELLVSLFASDGGGFGDPILSVAPGETPAAVSDDDDGSGFGSHSRAEPAGSDTWSIAVSGFGDAGFEGAPGGIPAHPESLDYELVIAHAPTSCDVTGDGEIDVSDIDAIQAGLGPAGPDDPLDVDGDGAVSIFDARACTFQCQNPECAATPPSPPGGSLAACGLLGLEPFALLGLIAAVRASRRRLGRGAIRLGASAVLVAAVAAPAPAHAISLLLPAIQKVREAATVEVDLFFSDLPVGTRIGSYQFTVELAEGLVLLGTNFRGALGSSSRSSAVDVTTGTFSEVSLLDPTALAALQDPLRDTDDLVVATLEIEFPTLAPGGPSEFLVEIVAAVASDGFVEPVVIDELGSGVLSAVPEPSGVALLLAACAVARRRSTQGS